MTTRQAMVSAEGQRETDFQIGRGLRAWAIERETGHPDYRQRMTKIVFGRSRSDAVRRAASPARLGEELAADTTRAAPIASGWDEPIIWPLPSVAESCP
jgi:hypothetical protein